MTDQTVIVDRVLVENGDTVEVAGWPEFTVTLATRFHVGPAACWVCKVEFGGGSTFKVVITEQRKMVHCRECGTKIMEVIKGEE